MMGAKIEVAMKGAVFFLVWREFVDWQEGLLFDVS
jgi:hypothetical protein